MREAAEEFEEIIADFYQRDGFLVSRQVAGVDMLVEGKGQIFLIETKLYRSSSVPLASLQAALLRFLRVAPTSRKGNRVLIIGGGVVGEAVQQATAREFGSISLLDHHAVSQMLLRHPDLLERYGRLVREIWSIYGVGPFGHGETNALGGGSSMSASVGEAGRIANEPTAKQDGVTQGDVGRAVETEHETPPVILAGGGLCADLRSVSYGKIGARSFEEKGLDALKYIFEDDLAGWSAQRRSENGHSVYDVVASVSSGNAFWRVVSEHFNARYVIFEFKNYKEKIKQGQVYTTEKYLFPRALRSLAIIVARSGADSGALRACKGALRESGKIILVLSLEDVCEMLSHKDSGDDYNKVLLYKLDKMLVEVER